MLVTHVRRVEGLDIDIDRSGEVRETSFARSVIHSFASLTYEQVQAVLDDEGFVHVGKLREYFDWVPERLELQSRVSPAVIHIGQRVRVRVASADLAARRIELEPG